MSMDSADEITFEALPVVEDTAKDIDAARSSDGAMMDEDPMKGMLDAPKKKEGRISRNRGLVIVEDLVFMGVPDPSSVKLVK
jgi:hypothetical protein